MNVVKQVIAYSAILLARVGLIDEHRGRRVADIAWPRIVTGLARISQRTADFAMVGLAVGPSAVAGMGFAYAYWAIITGIGFSLANGSMTFVSQHFGAGDPEGVDLSIKQALWVQILVGLTFTVIFAGFPRQLISLLGASADDIAYGSLYLQIVSLVIVFEYLTQVSSRALLSANDAWTPMVIRGGGAIGNIFLNIYFIFGLGLGVFGAALGTLIATIVVSVCLNFGMVRGRLPGLGEFPVQVRASPPYFDRHMTKQLLEVSIPLMVRRLVSRGAQPIMLAIIAQFGTLVVAAYVVSREVRSLMNSPVWGFSIAARSLVGQELGSEDEEAAAAYGSDILRFTMVVYAIMAAFAFVFAAQLAPLFTDDPETIERTIPFIQVMAVSLLAFGVDGVTAGILSAGGDTRWPLYARLLGLYVFMLPLAYLGVVTSIGILALYLAIIGETLVPAAVTFLRYKSGKWKVISRQYRPSASD